jgi:Ca-activated chloride channel homolog
MPAETFTLAIVDMLAAREYLTSIGKRLLDGGFQFGAPAWWLLLIPFVVLALLRGRATPIVAVRYSSVALVRDWAKAARGGFGAWRSHLLRLLAVCCLIGALARPQVAHGTQQVKTEGIDIMLVLDFSYSMQEGTLIVDGEKVPYIDVMRRITRSFIEERPKDRLGIIGFAVQPYLVSPITSDHDFVLEVLDEAKMDLGTAIGSAMVFGVKNLATSDRKTRIMVVVTDGDNNIGVSPYTAAKYAGMKGIRIYPVKITGDAVLTPRRIAAEQLYNVAKLAKGQFFQATDFASLKDLYEEIELLEKSLIEEETPTSYQELYAFFALPGLLLLMLDLALALIWRRRLP